MNIYDMTLREQSMLQDEILLERLDDLLPILMGELKVECWIVTGREYNEDPVLHTLLPSFMAYARMTAIFVFLHIDGDYKKIALDHRNSALNKFYDCVWDKENETQLDSLERIIDEYKPSNVALNTMSNIPLADGLTVQILANIKPYIKTNIITAEKLCIRWLETRTDKELEVLKNIVTKTHEIIENSFSGKFIIPGESTTQDIEWHMREQIVNSNGVYWFGPDVDYQRKGESNSRQKGLLEKGDLIHCDIGITFMGYNSDVQRLAYILGDYHEEMQRFLELGNDLQNELSKQFIENRSGNEILKNTMTKVRDKEYESMIYTHPIGLHGHGIGPSVGKYDNQNHVPIIGEIKLSNKTCYAMELNISKRFKAWDNQLLYIYLEEDILFKDKKVEFLCGRQEKLIVIRRTI